MKTVKAPATSTSKVFVGLDLSLSGTGCASVAGGVHSVKTIRTKPEQFGDDLARIIHIRNEISKFLDEHRASPEMVCVEDIFIPPRMSSSNTVLKLAMLGGIVRVMLYERGVPFCLVTPMQLKKFVLGKGQGEKSLILREIYKRWGFDAGDDNQADAIGLAHLARAVSARHKSDVGKQVSETETESGLTKLQEEVVSKALKERPCYNF